MKVAYVVAASAILDGAVPAAPEFLPPRLRRGLSAHQRLVLDRIAASVDAETRATIRIVHGSEHGELETAVALARSGEPSPARFSTSVHSAAIGLASIAAGNRRGHVTLSAGPDTLVAALVDALAILDEDDEVLVVIADEASEAFPGHAERGFAIGLHLVRDPRPGAATLALVPDDADARPSSLAESCARLVQILAAGGTLAPVRRGFPAVRVVPGGPS